MMGSAEEGPGPIRAGAGVCPGAGDTCPEQEVLMGLNQAEKRENPGGSRSHMSRGKKTWGPRSSLAIWTAGIQRAEIGVVTRNEARGIISGRPICKAKGRGKRALKPFPLVCPRVQLYEIINFPLCLC